MADHFLLNLSSFPPFTLLAPAMAPPSFFPPILLDNPLISDMHLFPPPTKLATMDDDDVEACPLAEKLEAAAADAVVEDDAQRRLEVAASSSELKNMRSEELTSLHRVRAIVSETTMVCFNLCNPGASSL